MADNNYPYHVNTANVKRFLEHIPSAGVPDKVTARHLESVGFKSTNDRAIIGILKFIGFLSSSGNPTELWRAYRNKSQSQKVLAAALRKAYSTLFTTYPDANRKDNEALRNFFSSHTSVSESTMNLMVRTFKTMSDMADFSSADTPILTIHGMLNKRNECAHPNDFFPDVNMTLGYISELLTRVATLQPKTL